MNMDGIEWKRKKWSIPQRGWLWLNERAGSLAANHLVADHPEIARRLSMLVSSDRISMIPYGATPILSARTGLIEQYGLKSDGYYIAIARPEPENSMLEIVHAYSKRHRGKPLVILGHYSPKNNKYHRSVMNAAGSEVMFVGVIYDREIVGALRFHARAHIHGHTVGGTNPSLVEALAAGCAVIAHDNPYNRWVAGPNARYFRGPDGLDSVLNELEKGPHLLLAMKEGSRQRHIGSFTQEKVLGAYERLLQDFVHAESSVREVMEV
jgi:glycosyltransferase involved in cell wall biosynthesis